MTSLARLPARWAALILVASAIALVFPIVVAAAPKVNLQEVSEGLTCQCGCGLTVANCNHPNCEFSVPVREQIERMLGRGMSGAQVIGYFRGKYGEKILSAPTTQGFNLLAWVVPFAALIAGGVLIAFTTGRWRASSGAPPPADQPSDADSDDGRFNAAMRRSLERELRDQV